MTEETSKRVRTVKFEMGEAGEAIATTIAGREIKISFGDAGEVVAKTGDFPAEILSQALALGLKEALLAGTSALSSAKDKFDTAAANVADRMAGKWSLRGSGSGEGSAKPAGEVLTAYIQFRQKAAEKAKEEVPSEAELRAKFYAKWPTRKEQEAVRRHPEIAKIIAANKPKSTLSMDDLMG